MLASTMQISNNKPNNQQHQPTHHNTCNGMNHAGRERQPTTPPPPTREELPVLSGPNSAPTTPTNHPDPFHPHNPNRATKSTERRNNQQKIAIVSDPPTSTTAAEHMPTKRRLDPLINDQTARKLLRKEVIQPHLPVRLPCYDFVPIADPTFDSSLPTRGLSHWLRVLPTFVT